ncbi:MAG: TonB-dependent receptor [Rubrivivax sp.]
MITAPIPFRRRPLAAMVQLALVSASGAAWAQAQPAEENRIVITATKRQTAVQDTPLAVSAFSMRDLDKAQVKDLSSMQALVPNLAVEQHGDSGSVHVFLRGIGSTNHTELGDPAVAFHVDGVYSPRPQGATVLMFDLASVEVARGPQGTLFGRNATAGSVNLVTAKPRLGDSSGSAGVVLGDRQRVGVQAAMNLPLDDRLALRVAAISEKQDGWVEFQPRSNVQPGAARYGAINQTGVRATLLWEPADSVTGTFAAEYFRDNGAGNIAIAQTQRAGQPRYSALVDTPGVLDQNVLQLRSRIDWRPTNAMEFSYIASATRMQRKNASDNDAGSDPGFKQEHRTEWSRFDSSTHEINLKSTDNGPFQWIAGAFLVKEDNRIRFDIDISDIGTPAAGGGPIVVRPVLPTDTAWAMSFIQPKRTLDSKAVFGQGTFKLSKDLGVTVGARYTDEGKKDVGGRNWVCPDFGATVATGGRLIGPGGSVDAASCNSAYAPGTWPGGGANDGETNDSAGTYLLRGEWQASKDLLTYATLSTGFKSGGLSDGGRRHLPEKVTNLEFGAKAEFFDRALALNLAAFLMTYKDMQVSSIEYQSNGQQQLVTSNAARSTIKGIEAEWSWRLTKVDRFSGNVSLLDAQYDDFVTCDSALLDCANAANVVNLKGTSLPHAPKFSTTFAYEHDFVTAAGGRWTPRVQVHHETETLLGQFAEIGANAPAAAKANPDARKQKAYSTLDLSLRYEEPKGRWYGEAFVVNAADTAVKTDASWLTGSTWASFYRPPRTLGLRANYRF